METITPLNTDGERRSAACPPSESPGLEITRSSPPPIDPNYSSIQVQRPPAAADQPFQSRKEIARTPFSAAGPASADTGYGQSVGITHNPRDTLSILTTVIFPSPVLHTLGILILIGLHASGGILMILLNLYLLNWRPSTWTMNHLCQLQTPCILGLPPAALNQARGVHLVPMTLRLLQVRK